ncbi:MAG: hypothetical protein ACTSWY_04300 [Promethearchaeota archaeon]
MAKKMKTTRYWTRKCLKCGFEYPNWFVSCPACHTSWNGVVVETKHGSDKSKQQPIQQSNEKTIKIIAQLTEENMKLEELNLFFSADNGISWFKMPMNKISTENENDYFSAEIENITINSTVIYYLKGIDKNNTEFLEDNNGNFFYYHVTEEIITESEGAKRLKSPKKPEKPPKLVVPASRKMKSPEKVPEKKDLLENLPQTSNLSENVLVPPEADSETDFEADLEEDLEVIFSPLDKIAKDKNLKECPNCQSKIKDVWAICPICGFRFNSF